MKRRALLLGLASVACATPEKRGSFAESVLAVADQTASLDARARRAFWHELGRLSRLARERLAEPRAELAPTLSALLFESRGFVREVEDTDLRFVLLPDVLQDRRGSCVGLGTLYLALAEALALPAHGVLRPGHFYVRFEHVGQHTNVEPLRRGEVMPDAWYERRFPAPGGAVREYGRALTASETLGVIEYTVGNERRRQRRIEDARAAYARAVTHFYELAEAHASLGATLHLLGRLDEARQSYDTAQKLNPHLPKLALNLSLLASERARDSDQQRHARQ